MIAPNAASRAVDSDTMLSALAEHRHDPNVGALGAVADAAERDHLETRLETYTRKQLDVAEANLTSFGANPIAKPCKKREAMQDNGHNRNGPTNPGDGDFWSPGDPPPDGPEAGETIELCNIQRKDEPHPCANIEPCPNHCGAKLRGERAGRKCSNNAMANGRCRMHGGHAARGVGHGQFKDGKRSRYSPKGIREGYERAYADGVYTEHRAELAVITAYTEQVLSEMGQDSEDWFKLLNERADRFEALRNKADAVGYLQEMLEIIELIRRGSQKYQKRRELREWIELRRRTAESETRRLEKEHQMVTREQVLMLMDQMGTIIYEEVNDRRIRARIAERVAELTD